MQGRQSDPLADSFVTAQWIWTAEDNETPPTAPGEDRAFRKTYTPPPGVSATSADILITADDRFSLYVSGKLVGASPVSNNEFGWITSQRFRVSLSPGSIVFAIRGTNLNDVHTGGDSAAGLLLAIRITHSDGSIRTLASDASWRASKIIPANFEQPAVDDSGWQDPIVLGKYGMSPWFSQVKIASALPNAGGASSSTTTTLPPSAATSTSTLTISGSPLPSTSTSSLPSSTISAPESGKPNTLIQSGTAISSGTVMPSLSNDPSATTSASSDGQKGGTSSSNSSSTGPIIGGVIGGVVILALLVLIVLCRKRLFGRRPRSFDADLPHHHNETRELLVEPFTLGMPARDPFQATLEPVRKHRNLPSEELQYRQDMDATTEGSTSVTSKHAPGASTRLQRLQDLMSELNREIANHGEGGAYVSELRGRIAELTREQVDDGIKPGRVVAIPPPYNPTPPVRRS